MAVPYWRLSGFYFFYFATVGVFVPYWSLYLKSNGFNPVEIGELSALLLGTKIIAPNLGGWLADHTGKSLSIIRIALFLAALSFAGFLLADSYWWFMMITACFSFFWNAALPQFEAATLFHLKNEPHRYSQIRLWGSIGFIIAVLGVGWLLDSKTASLSLLPLIIIALLVLTGIITLLIPEARTAHDGSASAGMLQIIKNSAVIAFLGVSMLLQIAHAPYYVFYSIYLKQYGYSATLTGGLWALGVLAEIVLFIYMRRLLKRFSLRTILLCSIALAIGRWLMIAGGVEYPGWLIVAQLLHAATFGAVHIAAIHLVHLYFGERHQGKGQALYGGLSFGLGGMLGSLYSGYYWVLMGPMFVYMTSVIACSVAFVVAYRWVGRENVNIRVKRRAKIER
jgi:PPP family 3-phenylpropionic acid transporter